MTMIFYDLLIAVFGLFGSLLLLRAYFWTLAISPRDPIVGFIWRFTDWFVGPVAYVVKPKGNWEFSCLTAALVVALVQTLLMREVTGFPATPVAFLVAPIALLVRWGIDLLVWMVLIYAILSFMGPRYMGYMAFVGTMVDPFLRPFRRVIPRIGRFDVTPIILFLILSILARIVTPASMGMLIL